MQRHDEEESKNSVRATEVDATLFSETKAEKKVDPILDIPKVPFDAERHQALIKGGQCEIKEYKTHISVVRIHAAHNKPGGGYGTAKFRQIVEKTVELECPGKITTHASTAYGSPHLFYLHMGMVPDARKCSYLNEKFAAIGEEIIGELSEVKEWSVESLEKSLTPLALIGAKAILHLELKIPMKNISTDDIVKNKELFLKLKDKKLDYVSEVFIPKLLKILAADPKNKYPDTTSLDVGNWHLSEKGYARWKYCLDNNLEFVPFRHFEHLDLSADQKAQLQEIFTKRAEAGVRHDR